MLLRPFGARGQPIVTNIAPLLNQEGNGEPRTVLSVGLSLNAKPLANCGRYIAHEKGPRSVNALTVATPLTRGSLANLKREHN